MTTRTRPNVPRGAAPTRARTVQWRGAWWAAQISPLLFSSYVWLILAGLAPLIAAALIAAGALLVAARSTLFGLWWRFGVSELPGPERHRVLAAVVPIGSLRGRRQPARLWEGRRMPAGFVLLPTDKDLVISRQVRAWVVNGAYTDEQISAVVAYGVGQQGVTRSRIVVIGEAFTLPWYLLAITATPVIARLRRTPPARFAWKVRWVIFAVALWLSASEGRWVGFWGVGVIATLSWSTGFLNRRWLRRLERLGDQRVIRQGLGPVLAAMLHRAPGVTWRRLERLRGSDERGNRATSP